MATSSSFSRTCTSRVKLAVVGAGVIGLSSAYHLAEKFGDAVSVTVIAERFTPHTTSDKASAILIPADFASANPLAGTDVDIRKRQWTADTFQRFNSLYRSEIAGEIQLCLLAGYGLKDEKDHPDPWWKELVFGFRSLPSSSPELQMLNIPQSCQTVWAFSTYAVDCRQYLPWIMREFVKRGGTTEHRKLSRLDELNDYDIIINCSGLGAVELVGDRELRPVRAQAVLVRAPWIRHFISADNGEDSEELTYVIPRPNDVLLGGTSQDGNWDETVDPSISEAIVSRCAALLPGLRRAEVIGEWTGGRPVRGAVRLETEKTGKAPLVIHCYGHGGEGISLHWGCALNVGRIVENYIATLGSPATQ